MDKRIPISLPNFHKTNTVEREIVTSLATCFIELAYIEISSYSHNKRQKSFQKVFWVMKNNVNLVRNKIFYLENSMIVYGIYKPETVEKIVQFRKKHNKTVWDENLITRLDS